MGDLTVVKKNYVQYIDKIIQNNKISHSYLIEVDDYDSDFEFVLSFVKMIICNISYEDTFKSNDIRIVQINDHNYPDIKVIEPDGTQIKKNQLLELQKDYSNKSLINGKRIYIIKMAEKLNIYSANTMLKFLEEPEENIIAILLTDNRYHVIDTIISRCQILSLKENNLFLDQNDELLELLDCVVHPNKFFVKYNYFVNNIIEDKNVAKERFVSIEEIIIYYLNYYYKATDGLDSKIINILEDVDNNNLLKYLSIIEEELLKLDYNINYKLWIDSLFSKLIIGG